MQTSFTPSQLADPDMAVSESVIRKCVHCGFCTATCPTYVLLGDELDSPRGRIYLMKDMLENAHQPTEEVVKHIDRCLSCLACMTTCPSGVNYMHLVDHARAYIHENYRRPWHERFARALLAFVLPHPKRLRLSLSLARLARPFARLLEKSPKLKPVAAMLALAPTHVPRGAAAEDSKVANPKGRVALLQGCVEPVLRPEIRAATLRLLNRIGFDVCFTPEEGCCGALAHHMGREAEALAAARRNVDAWTRELDSNGLDAILVTASGCGTSLKNYGFLLREDTAYAAKAARISALTKDISEWLAETGLPSGRGYGLRVAYHAACSLQHGQQVDAAPKALLTHAGFQVVAPAESHLCCGSAGTYNILQSEIATRLRDRKLEQIKRLDADVLATGNIGCAIQLGTKSSISVVHTVELLDWATGGPMPAGLTLSSRQALT